MASMNIILQFLLFLLLSGARASAAKELNIKEANDYNPKDTVFDFIIVGGGAAGCPLAATLSQKFKVLLLERGGSSFGNTNISLLNNVGANLANQGPDSPAQRFISTEGVPNHRARVLGGGTSINLGFYNRGSPDEIRQLGLDGSLANASFEWVEKVVASIPTQLLPYQAGFRKSLLEAGVTPDNGASFDFQPGTQTGASIFDFNQGTRRPASDLLLSYADRHNLLVLLHAEVELVLLNQEGPLPAAVGVKYRDQSGNHHNVYLNTKCERSEVILCAGTLGSPQLLLLSGIGPESDLRSLSIKVIVNSSGVGKNVRDNPAISISFPSPPPVNSSLDQAVGITSAFGSYILGASGPSIAPLTGGADRGLIIAKVAGPLSMGRLVLKSLNVTDTPVVSFNYFMDPKDLQTCVLGVNTMEDVLLAPSFRRFVYENQSLPSGGTVGDPWRRNPAMREMINTTIAEYCKRKVQTIHHHHGGCLKGIVVDSDYFVSGTKRLRVVDGSTLKFSPGTNPQATLMMLGRYMGVRILNETSNV